MSRSAFFSTIETALSHAVVDRIEICGTGFGKIVLLRSLARQAELRQFYSPGISYLNQTDPINDLLQIIFEQFYHVLSDVKLSSSEIRSRLSDRQALILFNHGFVA